MTLKTSPIASGSWSRQIARFLFGSILPKWAYPVVRGPLKGSRFVLGSAAGDGGGASIYFNLIEPAKTRAFEDIVTTGQILFDIGANIGYYTLLASKLVGPRGRVFAFEPAMRNLVYLYQHVKLNHCNNVVIIPAACTDQLSLARFSFGASWAMGHIQQSSDTSSDKECADAWVPTISVDTVARLIGQMPDAMKIDVEGAELSVLQGAGQTLAEKKPKLLLAVHTATLRLDCENYLTQFGYAFQAVSDDGNGDVELLAIAPS